LGDARLGGDQHQRFLPTRFDPDGNALDTKDFSCRELACPRCHLTVPRAVLETEPVFVSILGVPARGKSFFLTAMTWELRRLLLKHFALTFADADPVANRHLNEYEESLFLNPRADVPVPLGDLIPKTELQGELYDTVTFGNQRIAYPRPFLFSLQATEQHPLNRPDRRLSRVLCLYDNAGEHFQPGQDSTANAVTQHLARSQILMFLFDPTQDPRFRERCSGEIAERSDGRTSRQESVLHEAAARVRRHTGSAHRDKHDRPLIVVVTKFDAWQHLLTGWSARDPWEQKGVLAGVDLVRVEAVSDGLRELMLEVCPEVVAAAENFAQRVVYVPVSALGTKPSTLPQAGKQAVRTADIRPTWVTVPLLYSLARWVPGIIPAMKRRSTAAGSARINVLQDRW
jgi:hypothetical protein